jgi:hypothetical protein
MTQSFDISGSRYTIGQAATVNGQRRVFWQRWRLVDNAYRLDCSAWLPPRSTRRDIVDMLC